MSCIPLFHAISTAISKFPPYSLHRHPDSPNLLDSYPDFRHFPHSNTYSSHFSDSVPRFHISVFTDSLVGFESLRIYFKKIVTLVHSPLLLLHKPRHQIIFCIIHDVIDDITKNYLPYSKYLKYKVYNL